MRLIPGTAVTVLLDDDERRFTLVAAKSERTGRTGSWLRAPVGKWLNIAAPLAVLLGMMSPGNVVKAWTPSVQGAEPMRVELIEVIR